MNKKSVLFLIFMCVSFVTMAQDVIVKKDKSEIQALILRVDEQNIEYKKWNNQSGPTFVISLGSVAFVKFANGEMERFGNVQQNNQQNDYQDKHQPMQQQTDNNNEVTEAILRSQIANQKGKLEHTIRAGAIITTIAAIGTGAGVAIPADNVWLGAGIAGGMMIIGIVITRSLAGSYQSAIWELEQQLKNVSSKSSLSLAPVIMKDKGSGNCGTGCMLLYSF
jgi:hypothetical protein